MSPIDSGNEDKELQEDSKKVTAEQMKNEVSQQSYEKNGLVESNFKFIKNLKFSGMKDPINPKLFIENLEYFAKQEKWDEREKENRLIDSLIKYAAIRMEEQGYGSYEEMKKTFLDFYWNLDIQASFRNYLEFGRYNKKCKLTMANYFFKYAIGAKFLDSIVPEREIIIKLSKHFDKNIEREFFLQNIETTEEAIKMLKRIEALKMDIHMNKTRKSLIMSLNSSKNDERNDYNFWGWLFFCLAAVSVILNVVSNFYIRT